MKILIDPDKISKEKFHKQVYKQAAWKFALNFKLI
jgi:hypothetical protein